MTTTTTTMMTKGSTTMATYADTYTALSRAVQTRAVSVTIDTDMGEVTLTPAEALAAFDDIAPGEGFTLVSVTDHGHHDDDEKGAHEASSRGSSTRGLWGCQPMSSVENIQNVQNVENLFGGHFFGKTQIRRK